MTRAPDADALDALDAEVADCRRCPRLVEWRERIAREKVARYRDETYWGRPVPGLRRPGGPDPDRRSRARPPTVATGPGGSSPATGRATSSTQALYAAGLSSSPISRRRDDGLILTGVRISAVVHCAPPANTPTTDERDACLPYLGRELALLPEVRVILALGAFGWDGVLRAAGRPRPPGPAATAEVRSRGRGAGRAHTSSSAPSIRASRTRSPDG